MKQRFVAEAGSRSDAARFLGIAGRGGQAVAGLFLVTQVVLAFTSGLAVVLTFRDLLALAILVTITVLVMFPGAYPLTRLPSGLVVLGTTGITILVNSVLPDSGWPGYQSWHFGANTMVLLALGLRGRNALAWLGMALMAACTVGWTISTGQGIALGINLIDRNAATLFIGTVFSIGIRRAITSIAALHRAEQQQESDQAFAAVRLSERRAALITLEAAAVPALVSIAADEPLEPDDRRSFLLIEAGLRDAVRAPTISREPLASSVERARSRGQEVVLLDDSGAADIDYLSAQRDDLLARASAILDASAARRITVRLVAQSHEQVALTVVQDEQAPVSLVAVV